MVEKQRSVEMHLENPPVAHDGILPAGPCWITGYQEHWPVNDEEWKETWARKGNPRRERHPSPTSRREACGENSGGNAR